MQMTQLRPEGLLLIIWQSGLGDSAAFIHQSYGLHFPTISISRLNVRTIKMIEGAGESPSTSYILIHIDILTKPEILHMPPFIQSIIFKQLLKVSFREMRVK